jgi:hypothetical protein
MSQPKAKIAAIPRQDRQLIYDEAPGLDTIHGAVVTPRLISTDKTFKGEVYWPDGSVCVHSLRPSSRAFLKHSPGGYASPATFLSGRYLYIGDIFEYFGHDLFELTGRLWPLLPGVGHRKYDGVIAQIWRFNSTPLQAGMNRTALAVLSAFGVPPSALRFVWREPVRVETLDVAQPAFRINDSVLVIMRKCLEHLSDFYREYRFQERPSSVFMSRFRLFSGNRSPHEGEIEMRARHRGMFILHPQEIDLRDQISLMRHVRVIAGVDGSAMHLAAFCRPGARVVAFDTRNVENQYVIEKLMELQATHLDSRSAELGCEPLLSALDKAISTAKDSERSE